MSSGKFYHVDYDNNGPWELLGNCQTFQECFVLIKQFCAQNGITLGNSFTAYRDGQKWIDIKSGDMFVWDELNTGKTGGYSPWDRRANKTINYGFSDPADDDPDYAKYLSNQIYKELFGHSDWDDLDIQKKKKKPRKPRSKNA